MSDFSPNPLSPKTGAELEAVVVQLKLRWGWVFGLGVVSLGLGLLALALVTSATLASVMANGVFMAVVGLVEITVGFRAKSLTRFLTWVLAGVLYLVAGVLTILNPVMASAAFTLMLGAGLVATGFVRMFVGYGLPSKHSRWLVMFSGVLTSLLGLLIVLGWPANSIYVLGLLLGLDLVFYGFSWIVLGLRLKP